MVEGHLHVVESLIKAGAGINRSGPQGASPLLLAVQESQDQIVELLVSSGADVNFKTLDDCNQNTLGLT